MSTLDTFRANLRRAVLDRETVSIGGGDFGHKELAEVLATLSKALSDLQGAHAALRDIAAETAIEGTERDELVANIQGICRVALADVGGTPC